MKRNAKRIAILLLIAMLVPVAALADTYDTATLVIITPPAKADVQVLYDGGIDIVGVSDGRYKALLTDDQLGALKSRGFGIEILYAEMQEDRARWAEANTTSFVTSYYTASTFNTTNPPAGSLMQHLLQQYTAHPDVTRLYNLGASQDGAYDIIAMKVTKNPDVVEAEPKIRLYANIHGDEKGGVMVTCDVLDTILAGYTAVAQNPTAKKLVDETEIWFIPIGNPYGNAHSSRYNSRIVDLNRNFWGPAGSDAPPAWSEKETQAIRDLTETATPDHAKKRFAVSISFHEGAVVFNSVWNYATDAPTDEPIFWSARTGGSGCVGQTIPNCPTLAPHGLAQAYKDGCTKPGFWYTEGYDWYGTRGDTNDWAYGAWSALDTTIELNTQKTPSASQIPTFTAQHRQAVLNYMMKVFQGIHGIMTDATTGLPVDGTVTATATASPTIPVPHTYQAIFTDPVAGDFHRVLQPGTYTVVCSAPTYEDTTITGVVVGADAKTVANCVMNPLSADLAATATAPPSTPTNGAFSELLGVTNNGPGSATGVQLLTSTPAKTTFVSMSAPAGWTCATPAVGATGAVSCQTAALAASASAELTMAVRLDACAGDGAAIGLAASVSSASNDDNVGNNTASTGTTAIDDGSCDDGNACTNADACVSDACIGTPISAPAEVPDQLFLTATTASWGTPPGSGGPAPTYDIARGSLGQWPAGAGPSEVCEQQQVAANQADLPQVPDADGGYWYLVRARTTCGIGSYGAASDGSPRSIATCP